MSGQLEHVTTTINHLTFTSAKAKSCLIAWSIQAISKRLQQTRILQRTSVNRLETKLTDELDHCGPHDG